jgi:hypothetical protein
MNKIFDEIINGIVYKKNPFIYDADDVIFEFKEYFRNNLNESFGTRLKKGDIVIYDVSKLLPFKEKGLTQKDIYSAVREMGNKPEFTQLRARTGVIESIDLLLGGKFYTDGREHFFIDTSRNNELYDDIENKTMENLKNRGFPQNNNIIYNPNKEEIAYGMGAKLFFEDSPITALRIIKRGIPVVMPKQEWNIKTHRDIILLDTKDAIEKHNLIDELESYSGKLFFRINDFVEFREYLKTIVK